MYESASNVQNRPQMYRIGLKYTASNALCLKCTESAHLRPICTFQSVHLRPICTFEAHYILGTVHLRHSTFDAQYIWGQFCTFEANLYIWGQSVHLRPILYIWGQSVHLRPICTFEANLYIWGQFCTFEANLYIWGTVHLRPILYIWGQSVHLRHSTFEAQYIWGQFCTFEANLYIWGTVHLRPILYIWGQSVHLRPICTFEANSVHLRPICTFEAQYIWGTVHLRPILYIWGQSVHFRPICTFQANLYIWGTVHFRPICTFEANLYIWGQSVHLRHSTFEAVHLRPIRTFEAKSVHLRPIRTFEADPYIWGRVRTFEAVQNQPQMYRLASNVQLCDWLRQITWQNKLNRPQMYGLGLKCTESASNVQIGLKKMYSSLIGSDRKSASNVRNRPQMYVHLRPILWKCSNSLTFDSNSTSEDHLSTVAKRSWHKSTPAFMTVWQKNSYAARHLNIHPSMSARHDYLWSRWHHGQLCRAT